MNEKIVIGPRDPKDPENYVMAIDHLREGLRLTESKFIFFEKYVPTNEKFYQKDIHYRREYVPQLSQCLSDLDFEKLIRIPADKDNCAFRLQVLYVKSGKMISVQIEEARVGGGGYFYVTPAVFLFNEEAEKAYEKLRKII